MTLLTLLGVSPVFAATLTVSEEGGGDYQSLQEAVDAASDGDVIEVAQGDFPTIFISGKELHVQTTGLEVTLAGFKLNSATLTLTDSVISGSNASVSVDHSTLELDGVRFVGEGSSQTGPAIESNASTITGSRVAVEDWGLDSGSPVVLTGSTVSFSDSLFSGTQGSQGGAINAQNSDLTLSSVAFSHCYAVESGGAVYGQYSQLAFEDVQAASVGSAAGGVLYLEAGTLSANSVQVVGAEGGEGGSAFQLQESTSEIQDLRVQDSRGRFGAVAVYRGSLEATDVTMSSNAADEGAHLTVGGGGSVTLVRSQFSDGQALRGGAVFVESGSLDVDNAIWTNNQSESAGGALFVSSGAVDIAFAVFSENDAEIGSAVAVADGSTILSGVIFQEASPGDTIANAGSYSVQVDGAIFYGAQSSTLGDVDMVGAVEADPEFVDGSWVPGPYSPALDGVTGAVDPDGTVADLGAYGGPLAWTLEDADGDGFVWGRDCDDGDADINEAAPDRFYDGVDSDCAGDDDYDADGDGYAAANFGGADCDDVNAGIHPGAVEISEDRFDQDCDGLLDVDADGDGWAEGVDCDESDPDTHPWAEDAPYDGVDSDCRGNDDYDADGDGYAVDVDCDDNDARINPATPELFNDGVDQDCDGYDAQTPDSAPVAEADPETYDPGLDALPWVPGETAEASMGCSSLASGGSSLPLMGLLAAFGLVFVRRRR